MELLFSGANHLCNFGRGHYEEHFCEISMIILVALLSAQRNHLCNFGRGHYEEYIKWTSGSVGDTV